MNRYQVQRPFVDYGIFHEVGSIITDVSIISNLEVKLHEHTLKKIGDELPEEVKIPPKVVTTNKVVEKVTPAKPLTTVTKKVTTTPVTVKPTK